MASSFPESEDILSNIFKRLPVESLRQCMHVNKQWYYLIQTSDFVKLHFNHQFTSPQDNYLLFNLDSSNGNYLSLRYDDEHCQEYYNTEFPPRESVYKSSWKIYGISHGLICFCLEYSTQNILIWNPAIRKIKELPASPVHFNNSSCTTLSCTVGLAFGYFVKTNDFKVVKISIYYDRYYIRRSTHVDVYSLSSNSWEILRCNYDNLSFPFIYYIDDSSQFVNGSAFWVCKIYPSDRQDKLIRLNIDNKSIEEIGLPTNRLQVFIRAWGEFLYLFDDWSLTMWVLKGGENVVWEKKKCIRHEGIPLGFRNNGDMIIMKLRESAGLASCDVDNESEEFVDIWPSLHISFSDITPEQTCYVFTESLVLLDDK